MTNQNELNLPRSEQPTAPYLDAVVAYAFRGSGRFHIPGHKGGVGADPALLHAFGENTFTADVPTDIEGIDTGPSPTPYERAERLAAEAYGAKRTWFLTNGATQGNHSLCLALAPLGKKIIAQRNSHASVVDGLVLSGGVPAFVHPAYDDQLGMANGVEPKSLAKTLEQHPDAVAVFVVSPTYYGMAADIAGCAQVAHAAGVPLIVDQSWGPHFGFHPDLPPSALDVGADAVLTSTHKIVGSLTQSAMLHVAPTGRVDVAAVQRTIRLARSTSPSSLLLASLDGARRQLAVHGEALLQKTLAAVYQARERLAAVEGITLIGEEMVGTPGVAAWDPLRIVLDVRGTGCTGYEVAHELRQSYDLFPELATHATVVLVAGLGEPAQRLERMAIEVAETVRRIRRSGTRVEALNHPPTIVENTLATSPRDAFLGEGEVIPVDEAVGRISCESIAGYPPGIPALLPGELITAQTLNYLKELLAGGGRLHGASDPELKQITVLKTP